jgi:hypothetical protein
MSFTFAGHSWTDHEWLSELLLYGLYSLAGLWGTIVFFAFVICAAFGLVYARMACTGSNKILALFVLSAAFAASSSTWGARPQMLTLLFLAAYALLLDRYVSTRDHRLLWIFPLLMLVWANAHGGWVLGLAYMTIVLAGEWLNTKTNHEGALAGGDLRALGFVTVLTYLAVLVNPTGIHEALYPLVWIAPTAYSNVLTEWVSTDFHQPVFMVFEALLLSMVAAIFVSRPRINWTHLFLIGAFTYLALSEGRNVAIWCVAISPLLVVYLQKALGALSANSGERRLRKPVSRRAQLVLNVSLLALAGLAYPFEAFHFVNQPALSRSETTNFPLGATTYMAGHSLPSRTFAAYAWGGYLLWRLYPRYQDFIDGRANTLFDTRVLGDYLAAETGQRQWRHVMDEYHVGNVLVPPTAPLAQLLAQDSAWRLDYHDRTAVLYTRK